MTFAHPSYLYGLIVLPVLVVFLVWAHRRRMDAITRLGNPTLIDRLTSAVNMMGRRWKTRLWLVAVGLVIVALARPQWGNRVESVDQEGVQVMVALDISNSMLAEDIRPNRLTRAKLEISDLMNRLDGDEIGLVLFSGASFIQFPLTSDYETARSFLNNANPNIISRQGTAIGEAIDTALSGFDEKLSSQKVIVIVTDGENHESDVTAAAQRAANEGVIIYTIGFGSPDGEPVPEFDDNGNLTGYKKDQNGDPVLSKLDESTLQQIASVAGGQYFRAQADGSELDSLAGSLNDLQQSTLQTRFQTRHIERYQGFLLAAFLLLVLAELIPERRRETRLALRLPRLSLLKVGRVLPFFILVLVLAACESAEKQNNVGNEAFNKGDYETALTTYQDAQKQDPNLAEPYYNAANTYYRQEDFENAQVQLQTALAKGDDTLAEHSYYNLGNIAFNNQDYQAAVDAYENALRINPYDADAKVNLELALQKLQEQQQQQQNQDDQNQDDQNQDQQQESSDQQNQDQQQDQNQQQNQDAPNQDQGQQNQSDQQPQQGQNQDEQQSPDQQNADQQQQNQDGGQASQDQAQATPQASQDQQPQDGLTEDQARQLLSSVAQGSTTLQEKLQGVYVVPGGNPPAEDW